jgi:serine/threonine-protein kinase
VVLGGYRIDHEIGRGGMGVVYLAEHPVLGTKAAVKVLRREFAGDPELARRFIDEARAAARIGHAGSVEIFDLLTLPDGRPCILMEYIAGETLASRLSRASVVTPDWSLFVILQVCEVLGVAHAKGVVHRDVKPQNIMLIRCEGGEAVKLLDFGLARIAADDAPSNRVRFGTPQ